MTKYAIVDIETTGGSAMQSRIIEIAIVIHDGTKIIDSFESLLDPGFSIPGNITQITGITTEMVAGAPKFHEIARQVVEMTKDCVFVAHNVRFDYSFIREEFRRLGYTYTRRQLCTVRMSRETFPGLSSYSLGNLISHFNIHVTDRHRAMADVQATIVVLEMIFQKTTANNTLIDAVNAGIRESKLPESVTMDKIFTLPEDCGVYYLHDQYGNVVYVGKSLNIQKRIIEHFRDITEKAAKLQRQVYDITYEITGSELGALLLESFEIKRLRPPVNKAQRVFRFPYAIYSYINDEGFLSFNIAKNTAANRKKKLQFVGEYASIQDAKGRLKGLIKELSLCAKMCHLEFGSGPCFYKHIHQCLGACAGEETPENYNVRAALAIQMLDRSLEGSFFLLDKGRYHDERTVIWVSEGEYKGFGYIDNNLLNGDPSELIHAIKHYPANPDIQRIIRHFISKKKGIKMVKI